MRIAISLDTSDDLNSKVAHHFGRCPYFAIVDIDDCDIQAIKTIQNPFFAGHQPGQVPGFIKEQGAEVMLSGGMGMRAIQFFEEFSIRTATGAAGTVQQTLDRYLAGELNESAPCKQSEEHHEHGHHHHH